MRFLITLVALFGYAAAGALYSPLVLGHTAGDVQAAVIDANVAATDTARAIGESHARAAEAAVQYNTEAVRQVAEANRDLHENAYWGSLAASQNLVAAAQSQAAAIDGVNAAARGAALGVAPLAYGAHLGLAAYPYGLAGLGLHGLHY